jgi:hypothetical protein
MATQNQSFEIYQGDSKTITIPITDTKGGSAITGTGSTAKWVMVDGTGAALITKGTGDITFVSVDGAEDAARFTLVPADTSAIAAGVYKHELEETDIVGNVATVTRGTVTVKSDLID